MNYSITLITRNLFGFAFGEKAQMPHNPASIARLFYGERAGEDKLHRNIFPILPPTV
jgi:hypothetical protein